MKKLINFRPICYLLIMICLGIITFYSKFVSNNFLFYFSIAISSILLILFLVLSLRKGFRIDAIIFAIILVCLFFFSGFFVYKTIDDYQNANLDGNTVNVEGRVCESTLKDGYNVLIVDSVNITGAREINSKYKISVYIETESKSLIFDIGDKIKFTGKLTDLTAIYEDSLSAGKIQEGIKYSIYLEKTDVTKFGYYRTPFEVVNVFMRDTLKEGLDDKEFAVAYALMLGNSDYMETELLDNFRASGIAHIFAVSGLHIGFLSLAIYYVLKKLRVNSYVNFVIVVLCVLFYAGACGFTASSIRAVIMVTIYMFSKTFSEKYDILSSISIAGILILLISPIQLFCVGFQLSFAIVFGIAILSNPFNRLFKFMPKKLASTLSTIISAQIASFPILINTFGGVSALSILFNFIFIPIVSVVYIFTFICTICGGLFGVPTVFLFIPNYILKAIVFIFNNFDFNFFLIGGFSFFGLIALYYIIMLISSDIINIKRFIKILYCISLSIILVASTITLNVIDLNTDKIYIIGSDRVCASVLSSKENTLIVSYSKYGFSMARIKRAVDKTRSQDVANLFLLNSQNEATDQQIITKIYYYYKIKNVYLFNKTQSEIDLLKASFTNINFVSILEENIIIIDNGKYQFSTTGTGLYITDKNKEILITSRYNTQPKYDEYKHKNYDIIISYDYIGEIKSIYSSTLIVSYLNSNTYKNAQKQGNFLYKIA